MESDVICISIQAYLDCTKLNPILLRKEGGKSSLLLTHPPRAALNRNEGFSHRIKQGDGRSLCFVTLVPLGARQQGQDSGKATASLRAAQLPHRPRLEGRDARQQHPQQVRVLLLAASSGTVIRGHCNSQPNPDY